MNEDFTRRSDGPLAVVHCHPVPCSSQKAMDTLDSLVAPFRIELRRPDKQFVHAQRVTTVIANQIVRRDDIALGLGHLLRFSALADVRDHSLVEQTFEGLFESNNTDIKQEHCEETRIEQMKDGMLHAT